MSHRRHGSYVKYVAEGCRCDPCKQAKYAYDRERRSRVAPPYVSAAPARAHIAELAAAGVGLKQVAKASGLSHGALSKLVYDAEVELNRTVVASEPDHVRSAIAAAWQKRTASGWTSPLTVDQMRAWQNEIDRIIADHHTTGEAA